MFNDGIDNDWAHQRKDRWLLWQAPHECRDMLVTSEQTPLSPPCPIHLAPLSQQLLLAV